jgi:hypothetical protein
VLEVRIDRRDGAKVTVDDCARASRAIEARLDGGGRVAERYVLEVSSPGMERPLRRAADWRRFVGRWASVNSPALGGRSKSKIVAVEGEDGASHGGARCGGHRASGPAGRGRGRAPRWYTGRHRGRSLGWSGSAEILTAIRELSTSKQLERTELHDLLQDGISPRWPRSTARPCRPRSTSMRSAARSASCSSRRSSRSRGPGREISLEEARYEDEELRGRRRHGDPGRVRRVRPRRRAGRQAAHRAARPRGRAHQDPRRVRGRVGDLLSGEIQQIERGKLVVMLNKFREAEAIIPYREQNHREHYHQGEPIRAVLKRVEETPRARA